MRITLPGPAEVVYKPQPHDAMRVMVSDPEDPLAIAGFEDADVIVAIDGKQWESAEELEAACEALPAKETATLSLLRCGVAMQLRIKPKELFGEYGVAGRFLWALR
jgi:S1-C subfamily serine protease